MTRARLDYVGNAEPKSDGDGPYVEVTLHCDDGSAATVKLSLNEVQELSWGKFQAILNRANVGRKMVGVDAQGLGYLWPDSMDKIRRAAAVHDPSFKLKFHVKRPVRVTDEIKSFATKCEEDLCCDVLFDENWDVWDNLPHAAFVGINLRNCNERSWLNWVNRWDVFIRDCPDFWPAQ